jgi:hypothetical protein
MIYGIDKDFRKLMEQVYGPLGKKEQEESARTAKELVDNAVQKVKKMTENEEEIEKVKAQIKVLEKKLSFLEEIERQPRMELIKDGSVYCVVYNDTTYYRMKYRYSEDWVKWWREDDEGRYLIRVDDAETFRLLEQLFGAEISANPQGSLKFTFGPTLYDVIEDWWSDVFCANSTDNMETSIHGLVGRINKWLPKLQSAAGSQSVGVEELVEGWNDCLDTIKRKLG